MLGDKTTHPEGTLDNRITGTPAKVDVDFTDARLTHRGGWIFLGQAFSRLGLGRRLSQALSLKCRRRGASDAEMVLSLVASKVAGGGALSDVDALRCEDTSRRLLGLTEVPDSRRLSEHLSRFGTGDVASIKRLVSSVAADLGLEVVAHKQASRGYVPVFVDGSAIEAEGRLFEDSGTGYDGTQQYWLHGVFVGGVWTEAFLHPGGVSVTTGWREQLESIRDWFGPDDTVSIALPHPICYRTVAVAAQRMFPVYSSGKSTGGCRNDKALHSTGSEQAGRGTT